MSVRTRASIRKSYGFTLIELVIVIAVIAILAALLVPTILGQGEKARVSRAKNNAAELVKALARVRADTHFHHADPAVAIEDCYSIGYLAAGRSLATKTATEPACGDVDLMRCADQTPAEQGESCWGGPYLHAAPDLKDPWGRPWVVTYEPATMRLTVTSQGQDAANAGDDITLTQ